MKRIWGLAAVLVLGSAAPSLALLGPETSIGIRVGTGIFQSDKVFGETTDIESATVLGVTAGMRQGKLGGEISVDQISVDLKTNIKEAEVVVVPILLTVHFHPMEEEAPFDPYLGAGVGFYKNSAHASSEARKSSGISVYKVVMDDSVGFHLAVGANLKVSSVVAFVVDARYAFTSTDLTVKGFSSSVSDTLSVNGLVVTAGLKYLFPK
ncbi:MAG: outer membrane beta-barrel protein [Nitrospirae bacterium]|nr:outer membrane beta-barrel protein [Nitrospirota bacterium]